MTPCSVVDRCQIIGGTYCIHVGFEVLTALVPRFRRNLVLHFQGKYEYSKKSCIFWDITPCSPLKGNRRFGGTCLHLQGRIISRSAALLATCFHAGPLLGLFFDPEDGDDMFLRNVCWISTDYTASYPRRYNSSYCIHIYPENGTRGSSETLVRIYHTTRCHVQEGGNLKRR
jgi:hypothetical protein